METSVSLLERLAAAPTDDWRRLLDLHHPASRLPSAGRALSVAGASVALATGVRSFGQGVKRCLGQRQDR
jgi:hypothetical protein